MVIDSRRDQKVIIPLAVHREKNEWQSLNVELQHFVENESCEDRPRMSVLDQPVWITHQYHARLDQHGHIRMRPQVRFLEQRARLLTYKWGDRLVNHNSRELRPTKTLNHQVCIEKLDFHLRIKPGGRHMGSILSVKSFAANEGQRDSEVEIPAELQ